jgi:hypothetical protein
MEVGDLVKEIVTDPVWRLYNDTVGVVIRPADDDMIMKPGATPADMGLVARPAFGKVHHWLVAWGTGDVHIMNIADIEVLNASR